VRTNLKLLFTDIEMLVMDAYALAEKAQNIRGGLRVIVTSGRAQDRFDLPLVHKPFGGGSRRPNSGENHRTLLTNAV
jgi:hypothetical protein